MPNILQLTLSNTTDKLLMRLLPFGNFCCLHLYGYQFISDMLISNVFDTSGKYRTKKQIAVQRIDNSVSKDKFDE